MQESIEKAKSGIDPWDMGYWSSDVSEDNDSNMDEDEYDEEDDYDEEEGEQEEEDPTTKIEKEKEAKKLNPVEAQFMQSITPAERKIMK